MRLDETFRVADLPKTESRSFDPLPEGVYEVRIAGAEVKTTKAGNGKYLAIRYDVLTGEHERRVVFGNLTLRNPNLVAEQIGRQQLGELLQAIGKSDMEDTDELIGSTLKIKVIIRESDQYGPSNEVKGFRSAGGASKPAAAPAAAAPGKASPPWAKK